MALTDKDILITPNTGSSSADPKIEYVGADSSGNDTITVETLYDGTKATLSFEGSAGQLFSIVNDLTTDPIFSVNDVSGIPSIEVDSDGEIRLAEFSGNVGIGISSPTELLHVGGRIKANNLTLLSLSAQNSEATAVMIDGSGIVGIRELGSNAFNSTAFLTGNQTITLSGDVSGSGTTSISVTVADDSHNHVISNVDGLQTALDGKLSTTGTAANSQLLDSLDSTAFLRSNANDDFSGTLTGATGANILLNSNIGDAGTTAYASMTGRLEFDHDYSDTVRGPNKIVTYEDDSWIAGLGIHASTAAYYSGHTHAWYKSNSTTSFTQNMSLSNTGSLSTLVQGTVWGASNDGSGSGLDADLLDGQHGSYYLNYNNFTNTPTIPSLSGYATESYVNTQVSNLVASAPSTLDTLNELAAALGDDANFSTTVTNSIATKMPLAGGTFTGGTTYNVAGNAITISSEAPQMRFNDTTSGADDFWIHINSNRFYVLADRGDDGSWETPHPLELNASSNIGYIFGQRAFTEAYHPNADTLTTARTIALGGDLSGSASFNGSANITITATVADDSHNHVISNVDGLQTALDGKLSTSGTAANSQLLDSLDSTAFLRSNAADTASGALTFTGNINQTGGTFISHGSEVTSLTTAWQAAGTSKSRGLLPFRFQNGATGQPESGDNAHWGLNIYAHSGSSGNYPYGTQLSAGSTQNLWHRWWANGSAQAWRKVWDSSNDGSGSGLDADTLDGINSASFARSDAATTYSNYANIQRFYSNTNIATASGSQSSLEVYSSGSGNDAFMTFHVGGDYATYFGLDGGTNKISTGGWSAGATSNTVWHAGVDGSGSGLDADTVDGIQSSRIVYGGNGTGTNSISGSALNPSGHLKSGFYQVSSSSSTIPNATSVNFVMHTSYGVEGNTAGFDLAANDSTTSKFYLRPATGGGRGAWQTIWTSSSDGSGSGLDADLLDGLDLHTGRNNEANKVVRTDGNGYIQAGWINTTSGSTTGTNRIYASNDGYIRYVTPATLISNLGLFTTSNDGSGSGLDADTVDGFNTNATAQGSTLPVRDSSGDITARLFRSNYATQTSNLGSGADIAFRNDTSDNYIRFVDGTRFVNWLGNYDGSGSGLDADLFDGTQKSDFDHAEGFKTWSGISASATQARRFHIARLYGCPAHWDSNWQNIEFHVTAESYESGTLKFRMQGDYGGAGSQANMIKLYLTEVHGPMVGRFRFILGTPVDAGWDHSGQDTFYVDLYAEAAHYSNWKINAKTYGHPYQTSNPSSGGATTVFYSSPTVSNVSDFNISHNDTYIRGSKIWNALNDGSGSGLDADTLDGVQASQFLRSDTSDTMTAGTLSFHQSNVTAPTSSNATTGARLNLYPNGSGRDYTIGIESNNMWFNSDGGFKFYRDGALRFQSHQDGYFQINSHSNSWDGGMRMISQDGTDTFQIHPDNNGYMYVDKTWYFTAAPHIGSIGSPLWHPGNDGSGSGLDADTLDGQGGTYYNQSAYTSTGNAAGSYLGGHYSSGGNEKPNSSTFGSGKFKIAMLSSSNLGFGGAWNDVFWNSSYNGGDVKRSTALVSSKYDNTSLWIVKQNYDSTSWGTGYLFWNAGNDGSGSGLDADTLDGVQLDKFLQDNGSEGDFRNQTSGSIGSLYLGHTPTSNTGSSMIACVKQTNMGQPGSIRFFISPASTTNSTATTYLKHEFQADGDAHHDGDVIAYSTTTGSDRKLKKNIRDLEGSLDKTLKLRGVKFDWKDENKANDQLGFIAQEVEEVLPEVVKEVETLTKEDETHLTVNYPAVVPVLVEAIKEQQSIINRLEERLSDLENKLK